MKSSEKLWGKGSASPTGLRPARSAGLPVI